MNKSGVLYRGALARRGATPLSSTHDNGAPLGGGGSNFPFRGGKNSNFEGGVRVPAIVSGGTLPGGGDFQTVDIVGMFVGMFLTVRCVGFGNHFTDL